MGLFSNTDERDGEISALRAQAEQDSKAKKRLAAELAEARKRADILAIEVGKTKAELAEARQQVARIRQRQKASVERANRFKARLGASSGRV